MYVSDSYVLIAGLAEYRQELGPLFTELLGVDTGLQAFQQLRGKVPAALVAPWHLPDMPDGMLFRRILASGNFLSTVALVDLSDLKQEITARSLGVTVVADENILPSRLGELINHLSDAHRATGT